MMKKGKGYIEHVKPDVKYKGNGYITHIPNGKVPMGDAWTGAGNTPEVYGHNQRVGANSEWDEYSYVMPEPVKATRKNYKGGKLL